MVARPPAQPLGAALAQHGPMSWPVARGVALRLCGAVEAVRRVGLAPRSLDLESCILIDGTTDDVRLGGLFVPSDARLPETDAPAIAMIVHALLGASPRGAEGATEASGLDNVLLRALGRLGYASVRTTCGWRSRIDSFAARTNPTAFAKRSARGHCGTRIHAGSSSPRRVARKATCSRRGDDSGSTR